MKFYALFEFYEPHIIILLFFQKFEDLKVFDREDPDCKQSNLQKTYSKNVLKFLKDLKTSSSSFLQALQDVDIMDENLDCLKLLQNIATEQNFELIYIPIEQRGKSGKIF